MDLENTKFINEFYRDIIFNFLDDFDFDEIYLIEIRNKLNELIRMKRE